MASVVERVVVVEDNDFVEERFFELPPAMIPKRRASGTMALDEWITISFKESVSPRVKRWASNPD